MDLRIAEHTQYQKVEKPKDAKRSSRMLCCHMITGGAIIGIVQLVIIVATLAASALMLDRWRTWERLPYDPDWQTQTMPTTTLRPVMPVECECGCVRQWLLQYTPYSYQLENRQKLEPGWVMTLSSTVASTATAFSVSLSCDDSGTRNVPFHFNPRFTATPAAFVARNTMREMVFDKNEEQDGGMGGLAPSAAFVLRIELFKDYYEVSLGIGGGAMAKFIRYAHRTSYECVKSVQIAGDITSPFNVQYYWAAGSSYADVFSASWLEFCLTHHVTFLSVWLLCLAPYCFVFMLYDGVYIVPNLFMTCMSIVAGAIMQLAFFIRVFWPAERYETDGVEEGVLVYAIIFLFIWMLVMALFGWLLYLFYRWMNDEFWVAHRAAAAAGTVTLAAVRKDLPLSPRGDYYNDEDAGHSNPAIQQFEYDHQHY